MPELPEVEITARNLRRWLGGLSIEGAWFSPSRLIRGADPDQLARAIVGKKVDAVERRGKWICLGLSGPSLYLHLGMTGRWLLREPSSPALRFERARLEAGEASVRCEDARMLGQIALVPTGERFAPWASLGPDPLADGLDPASLARSLASSLEGSRRSIKEALLDQAVIAGVGNIQAAEALFGARLSPARPAGELSLTELEALARAVAASMLETIERDEGPEPAYLSAGGPNRFSVYGKSGEPCPRCGAKLRGIKQGGRSTVFCPRCQR